MICRRQRTIFCASSSLEAMTPIKSALYWKQSTLRFDSFKWTMPKICSDPWAQEIFDSTTCTSDFRYQTVDEMRECIEFFLLNYRNRGFIRFSIVNKSSEQAIGTMEMFCATGQLAGCEGWGVLRMDLPTPYEKEEWIRELLALSNEAYYPLMDVKRVVTKAIPPAAERIAALRAAGFQSFNWEEPGRSHYWVRDKE